MLERARRALLRHRIYLILGMHGAVFAAVYAASYFIRFEGWPPRAEMAALTATLPAVVAIKTGIFLGLGSHRGWWRYATFRDLVLLFEAATLSALALAAGQAMTRGIWEIPRSIPLIDWSGTILALGGLRAGSRVYRERYRPMMRSGSGGALRERALVYGAEAPALALIREVQGHPELNLDVVGLLDENPWIQGRLVGGVPVLGGADDLKRVALERKAVKLLVPSSSSSPGPSVPPATMRRLLESARSIGMRVKVVPGVQLLLSGAVRVEPRDVEIDDLLPRDPIVLEMESIRAYLRGKTVLVTGAAGSIGSEICRQTLAFGPRRLVMLDQSETGLFELKREFDERGRPWTKGGVKPDGAPASVAEPEPEPERVYRVGDIRDRADLDRVFAEHRPEVVFHAAAYKHVPMMEANPAAAVRTNVIGTRHAVDAALDSGAEAFVLISTDKAVNPSSVMGACKRLGEMYVQAALRSRRGRSTRLMTVRFGNVLGSNGSVVPVFKSQIRRGGPVTVTHREMTRYFMTIPEATQLVLQAGALGRGGEIFVLDMGEPVRILDLAEDLIRLSGSAAEIVFTGLRPGEKLHEELYHDRAEHLPTPHPKISVLRGDHEDGAARRLLERWDRLESVEGLSRGEVTGLLREFVPEYRPFAPSSSEDGAGAGAGSKVAESQRAERESARVPGSWENGDSEVSEESPMEEKSLESLGARGRSSDCTLP